MLKIKVKWISEKTKFFIPGNFFGNFKGFFHSVIIGLYGEKNEAHSPMISHGVMAITLKGRKAAKSTENEEASKLKNLFNVVDSVMRAQFALDE